MVTIILGPPGTGKTTKLLNICKEKKEAGVPWEKIGFFSFSQKALSNTFSNLKLGI